MDKRIKCSICDNLFIRNSTTSTCSLKCRIHSCSEKKENGCWEWLKSKGGKYGKLHWMSKCLSAHKASYLAFKGGVPEGLQVCHTCDNPICVNPDHLWLGTAKENMRDCISKNRWRGTKGVKWTPEWRKNILSKRKHADRKGEAHHRNKLTNEGVKEIREMLKQNLSQTKIAKKFGVDPSTISHIKRGRLWPHLN